MAMGEMEHWTDKQTQLSSARWADPCMAPSGANTRVCRDRLGLDSIGGGPGFVYLSTARRLVHLDACVLGLAVLAAALGPLASLFITVRDRFGITLAARRIHAVIGACFASPGRLCDCCWLLCLCLPVLSGVRKLLAARINQPAARPPGIRPAL
jgi:hypothetical protein